MNRYVVACSLVIYLFAIMNLSVSFALDRPVKIETAAFDYSKYLAPEAWRAIRDSQGVLHSTVQTFNAPKHNLTQALVIDEKQGLILSVAHGLNEFPDVMLSKNTKYFFIFRGKIYPVEPRYFSDIVDLSIFKIKEGDLTKLKPVSFVKEIEPLREYYSFSQRIDSNPRGFRLKNNIPWKACLVDRFDELVMISVGVAPVPVAIEYLIFDKSSIAGFSGGGIFNESGQLVGMIKAVLQPAGYSLAISVNTIQNFITEYKVREEEREKKLKK